MEPIKVEEILVWTRGKLEHGNRSGVIRSICTDTRTLSAGDFFIPLSGQNFDGHNFIPAAARKGASGSLFSPKNFSPTTITKHLPSGGGDFILIEVPDTRQSLLTIAGNYRKRFRIPVIAITGSSGKTTTKDLIAKILSGSLPPHALSGGSYVLANAGSFNNEIGLPLSLLNLNRSHRFAVLELGMNHPGEIDLLSRTARPTCGLITNIGSAHLGFFPNRKDLAAAKAELLTHLKNGLAVLPADDHFLPFFSSFPVKKKVTFGLRQTADYFPEKIVISQKGISFWLCGKGKRPLPLSVPLFGLFNLKNVLAACALTLELGIEKEVLSEQISSFKTPDHRFQITQKNGIFFVDDTYNANPASFREALADFYRLTDRNRKIVVAGSMAELGRFSRASHLALGHFLAKLNPNLLLLMGPEKKTVRAGAIRAGLADSRIRVAKDSPAAARILKKRLRAGDSVFLKGSRFLKMEEILDTL